MKEKEILVLVAFARRGCNNGTVSFPPPAVVDVDGHGPMRV